MFNHMSLVLSYPQPGPQETSQTDAEDKLEGACPRSGEPNLYTNTLSQLSFFLELETVLINV